MNDSSNAITSIGSPIEFYKYEVMRDVLAVKDAHELYFTNEQKGIVTDCSLIQARTRSLFNSLYAYLKRKLGDREFIDMRNKLFGPLVMDVNVLLEVFWKIQEQLDKDHIIKFDLRKSYNSTRVELENENFYL